MAIAKTNLFDNKLNSTSALFKALAHPARLAILRYLAGTRVCITGDISDELPLSRTTVNQHLKELRKAGLIQGTVEGVRVNYCLNPKKIREMIRIANCFFAEVDLEHEYRCGMKILILCTGNSCRSQMAEGFLRSFDNRLEVFQPGPIPHPAPIPTPWR